MRDPQKVINDLKARCTVYKIERLALLKVIRDLTDMLYDKFRNEDRVNDEQDSGDGG